ncbi:hypothetical protein LDL77_10975 [Flagellimonas marinaquae]|uniref:hypothetical protein n=1 Tax=Flagellimonas TaxID=444459 RepID=UPI000ED9FD20|nr:hypothetical protein [Muricauda sp. DH64]UBZ12417.1 hypothetical protein LDL77_10975 [Allomuricauda aquimarina]HCO84885.1 hypothetical protein [Arenibacter sp.]|tara:strand:+ start:1487 stop:1690 length:204 start_codon:yes stop_codon:yes gene_type:complete
METIARQNWAKRWLEDKKQLRRDVKDKLTKETTENTNVTAEIKKEDAAAIIHETGLDFNHSNLCECD